MDDNLSGGGDFCKSLKDADKEDRIGFVKKVYSILFVQLFLTGICIAVTITNENICIWMVFDYWWVWIPMFIIVIFIEIMLICVRPCARKVPINYIMLLLFTLAEAYCISTICA